MKTIEQLRLENECLLRIVKYTIKRLEITKTTKGQRINGGLVKSEEWLLKEAKIIIKEIEQKRHIDAEERLKKTERIRESKRLGDADRWWVKQCRQIIMEGDELTLEQESILNRIYNEYKFYRMHGVM